MVNGLCLLHFLAFQAGKDDVGNNKGPRFGAALCSMRNASDE
jgi:hypothetical protein